jgi:hypothetical protein
MGGISGRPFGSKARHSSRNGAAAVRARLVITAVLLPRPSFKACRDRRPWDQFASPTDLDGFRIFRLLVKIDNLWNRSISSWLDRCWTKNFDTPEVSIFGRITVSPDNCGFGARGKLWSPREPRPTPFEPAPEDAGWPWSAANLVPPRSFFHCWELPQ